MKRQFEKRLDELISREPLPYEVLFDAARYTLFSGGKRMRPLLTLEVATTLGAPLELALDPACAVEMVHTYSLIHDDLPAMDNDDFRRGKPTLHREFGEGIAILTGDWLLTKAFEVLGEAKGLTAEQRINLVVELSKGAGSEGMIGGQLIDLLSEGQDLSEEELSLMHRLKTARLIGASLSFGAIVAHQDPTALKEFGELIGLAFQIRDDLIDQEAGGRDHQMGKATFVTLLGRERAEKSLKETLDRAFCLLDNPLKPKLTALFSPLFVRKD